MIKKIFIILTVFLLAEESWVLGNEEEPQKSHQGTDQTIHTVKGHYNEEAKRISKCEENKTSLKKNNNKPSVFALNDSDLNNAKLKSIFNITHAVNDVELKLLAEILKSVTSDTRRSNIEEQSNVNDNNDYVVDKTQKQFEFESLLIKNVGKNVLKEKEESNEDTQKNSRRFYQVNENEPSNNYYNPFESTPPRSYTPSDLFNPNVNQKIIQGYNINYNSPNPILIKEKETTSPYSTYESSTSAEVTSGYNKDSKLKQGGEEDTDVLFSVLDKNVSPEDVKSRSDPTKGSGISDMDRSNVMLINHPRVCYACTSTHDSTCWSPNRKTPTKYCRKDHNACLTKTYIHKGYAFVIRDCGNSCSKRGLADLGIHYRSCTICHHDLCNAANSVRIYATNIIIILIALSCFKVTG